MRLTDLSVQRLKLPKLGRAEYWDTKIGGFGLRVSSEGARSWVLMYRLADLKKRRLTLGRYPAMTLAMARRKAEDALEALEHGDDPASALSARRRAKGGDVEAIVDEFIERYAKPNLRTWKRYEQRLRREVVPAWKGRRIDNIRKADVIDLVEGIAERGAPIEANRVLEVVRKMFNWLIARDQLEGNPAASVPKPGKETSRDRVLSDGELVEVWRAADRLGWPFGPLVQLLALTGQRENEVASMRWSGIDLEADKPMWTVPAEIAKNGKAHDVPLATQTVKILRGLPRFGDCDLVFPSRTVVRSLDVSAKVSVEGARQRPISGFSKAKVRLDREVHQGRMGVALEAGRDPGDAQLLAPWRYHDLRRTAASGMARMGVGPHVLAAILNHVASSVSGVTAIYNRHAYDDEKRAALAAWARHVEAMVDDEPSNAIPLREAVSQ